MGSVPYWVIAILMLGLLILVHELGHYLVGRWLKFDIQEFSIGMGPRIFGWEKKGIKYSLRCIPLGGFVAFTGEDGEDDNPRAMNNMPWYKRAPVLFAGAGFNLLFALLITAILVTCTGYYGPKIASVAPASNLAKTEIQEGDIVYAVNGKRLVSVGEFSEVISAAGTDQPLQLTLLRDGKKVSVTAAKYYSEESKTYLLGVTYGYDLIHLNAFQSVGYSFQYNWWMTKTMYGTLWQLITGKMSVENLTGPISTIGAVGGYVKDVAESDELTTTAARVRETVILVMELLVIISVNLAVMNLLPIPALDGFRLLFAIVEGITHKHIPRKVEGIINATGLVVLIGLMVVLEVSKLFV